MKDQAIAVAAAETTDIASRNRLREYLQHVLLRQLFERDLLGRLVFHGGSALRIVHHLPRFSEDLDFHVAETKSGFRLDAHLAALPRDLEVSGYRVSLRPRLTGAVQTCPFGFDEILFDCGLSPHASQKLHIRLEIDVNPPRGYDTETRLINAYLPYSVTHHDRPSFLAGKLHALLQRSFAKGRDFFDLLFYLSRWTDVHPNLPYLNAALRQTGYDGPLVTESNWKQLTAARVASIDFEGIHRDVEPFLLQPADLKILNKALLLQLLAQDP